METVILVETDTILHEMSPIFIGKLAAYCAWIYGRFVTIHSANPDDSVKEED